MNHKFEILLLVGVYLTFWTPFVYVQVQYSKYDVGKNDNCTVVNTTIVSNDNESYIVNYELFSLKYNALGW
jgi:hypothetical protein